MSTTKPLQAQAFTLYGSGAVLGATSIILTSFKDIDGNNITETMLGGAGVFKAFMTLEPKNGTNQEQICFTGLTQNANGTCTLTGVKSVTFATPYTETSGLTKTHVGGSTAILSNTSGFYSQYPVLGNDQTFTGHNTFNGTTTVAAPSNDTDASTKKYVDDQDNLNVKLSGNQTVAGVKTFTTLPTIPVTPAVSTDAASKGYVDGVAVAGAPNADTSIKGIVQEATLAEVIAGTTTGSTGARLYINPGVASSIIATGTMARFPVATPPTGWLVCDGSAVSRTTYSTLFALIGTTFGAGNGSTTFNLPADPFSSNDIAFVVSGQNGANSGTTFTVNLTIPNVANRELIVGVTNTDGDYITGVTCGGVAMTRLPTYGTQTINGTSQYLYMYTLANPPIGTVAIVATASQSSHVGVSAALYKNVDTSNPFLSSTGQRETATTTGSVTLTSSSDPSFMVAILGVNTSPTAAAGTTVREASSYDVYASLADKTLGTPAATSVTMSWTFSSTTPAEIAVLLRKATNIVSIIKY